MNWQDQFGTIYPYVGKHYQNGLWVYNQRMTNYADLSFSDKEVITLYLFGIIDKNRKLKQIYAYADRIYAASRAHSARILREPTIMCLANVFVADGLGQTRPSLWFLCRKWTGRWRLLLNQEIILLKRSCACGSWAASGSFASPEYIGLTGGSNYDGKVFEQIRPFLKNNALYADKFYQRADAQTVKGLQGLTGLTPIKKEKDNFS